MGIDIIEVFADALSKQYIDRSAQRAGEGIVAFRTKMYEIDSQQDKIRFLNILLKRNNNAYKKHLRVCTAKNPKDCSDNTGYEEMAYMLIQELARLGVQLDNDTFTNDEKSKADERLNKILQDLSEVKMGQEIIFNEIDELRGLYFLGKKKWHQLLIGKVTEMVASGIVGESVSTQIIAEAKKVLPPLLG